MNSEGHLNVSPFEATSFVTKFKDLWLAGHNASLLFETEAGEASATLRVALGAHPRKLHLPQRSPQEPPRYVTPSQLRRLGSREDPRHRAAAEAADAVAEEATNSPIVTAVEAVSGNASDNNSRINPTPAEEATDVSKLKTAEKVETNDFECNLCKKTFETMKGLRTHIGRQHKVTSSPIPQVDGLSDRHEPNYCHVCEECPDEIVTSEDVSYHVMNDHQVQDVREKYGNDWIHARQHCIRKGSPFVHLYPS
jgi:hypothetical protein